MKSIDGWLGIANVQVAESAGGVLAAAQTLARERVLGWAENLGAQVTSISVRPMTTKWASYSTTGRLTFAASILELRQQLQDYVIAHELLHFHVPNHGRLWKSLMRAHLGDHEQLERELRRVAHDLAIRRRAFRRR